VQARFDLARIARSAGSYALKGALIGLLLVGVGVIRGVVVLATGRHLNPVSRSDLVFAAAYVLAFGLAGAVVGVLRTVWSTVAATVVGFMLGGVVVSLIAGSFLDGSYKPLDTVSALSFSAIGICFGAAVGIGWLRSKGYK
jgi:hypothetical protein